MRLLTSKGRGHRGGREIPFGFAATGHRGDQAIHPVEPAVVEPAFIAHEMSVHCFVGARLESDHGIVARLDHDVAALGAAGAHRSGSVQFPGPRLVEKILR